MTIKSYKISLDDIVWYLYRTQQVNGTQQQTVSGVQIELNSTWTTWDGAYAIWLISTRYCDCNLTQINIREAFESRRHGKMVTEWERRWRNLYATARVSISYLSYKAYLGYAMRGCSHFRHPPSSSSGILTPSWLGSWQLSENRGARAQPATKLIRRETNVPSPFCLVTWYLRRWILQHRTVIWKNMQCMIRVIFDIRTAAITRENV